MLWLISLATYVCLMSSFDAKLETKQYSRVCYYSNWAQYRPAPMKFFPENIDPNLCTHIIFAFAKISGNELKEYEWNDNLMIPRIVGLKKKNPDLKVLIAVGGWNHETSPLFRNMASNKNNREIFIESAVKFIQKYKLDGLDLDWEYPTLRPTVDIKDKKYFTLLCKELKEAFADNKYLLTAAVSANSNNIPTAYETNKIYNYLDALHLMTYDLAGTWDGITGQHTATKQKQNSGKHSVIKAIDTWVAGGFKEDKIVLGLATYGRAFTLLNTNSNGVGAKASRIAPKGRFTREAGFISYYEICELKKNGMKEYYDSETEVPYGVKGNIWVGYENVESIKRKVNYLIKGRELKGAMFWALDLDDFSGSFCGNRKEYPLINAVKEELENDVKPKVKPDDKPDIKPKVKPETKPDAKPKVKPEVKPEIKPDAKPDVKKVIKTVAVTKPKIKKTYTFVIRVSKPKPKTTKSTKNSTGASEMECKAVGRWAAVAGMPKWCTNNCKRGYCPKAMCKCKGV